MTLTETTQNAPTGGSTQIFDAVKDDPALDSPDMTWAEFAQRVSDWPARDGVKTLLNTIYVRANGQRGQMIDVDHLAEESDGKRKKSTIVSALPVLAENGWLDRTPIPTPGKNRWTTGWVTTKFIQG